MQIPLRDFVYAGRVVGKVNHPVRQIEGIYIYTTPKKHVDPETLRTLLICLLDKYKFKIGTGGEVYLTLPRGTRYGPILNGIARAYFELQTGKRVFSEGQQQLLEDNTHV